MLMHSPETLGTIDSYKMNDALVAHHTVLWRASYRLLPKPYTRHCPHAPRRDLRQPSDVCVPERAAREHRPR